MKETQHIRIENFAYDLPDERIAKYPLSERDQSRLLLYRDGKPSESSFFKLPEYIPSDALMVFNNTKVIQARMHFHKTSGALIEIFCLEPEEPRDYVLSLSEIYRCTWVCMIGNLKKWKEGSLKKEFKSGSRTFCLTATKKQQIGSNYLVEFEWDGEISFAEVLDRAGELPIPPYLNRETEEKDKETYQTVYSKIKGSVAAPTAGLHFTERVLQALHEKGVVCDELTLHVGAGTFKPVKSDTIEDHEMHIESFSVSRSLVRDLIDKEGKIFAVGTTSVRTLESLYYMGLKAIKRPDISEEELVVRQWEPYQEQPDISTREALKALLDLMDRLELTLLHTATQIIIAPGYHFHIVSAMVTNFHQPRSTLLLLVSAFVGGDWKRIYDFALSNGFRFLSYGDSSLLFPASEETVKKEILVQ
ncbi:MAG: S-adenosylmethionine:tRNA ribosyltransferase-isomerase [Bacteroidales bacterium]|nr:S-adenosylmethionine:tRNA ribosyltransferase-isomerase [Bacteroidales bacterium]